MDSSRFLSPERVPGLLDGFSGPVAKRLSTDDLALTATPATFEPRGTLESLVPKVEPDSVGAYITTLVPDGRGELPSCGYLCIGVDEGPSESYWSFFWGFVGPSEEPHLSEFGNLDKNKRLREEVWEIEADIPARGILRWFGVPLQGPDHFVEIKSFGVLGAQMASWVRDFEPAAVLMDLPNDCLLPASQRVLPQLIGADLERLLPLLRVCNGLPPSAPNLKPSPYPVDVPDIRRRRPLIFLSYSRKDDLPEGDGMITQLYRALQGRQPGITFFDSSDLKAGDEWRERIDKKISETAVLAVLVSSNSLQSSEVELEFQQFVAKLTNEDWPGVVVPIPVDAESFEFFREGNSTDSDSWWNRSTPVGKGNLSEVGLASFNFERESLGDLGPDRTSEKLLSIYSKFKDGIQERLSQTNGQ